MVGVAAHRFDDPEATTGSADRQRCRMCRPLAAAVSLAVGIATMSLLTPVSWITTSWTELENQRPAPHCPLVRSDGIEARARTAPQTCE